MAQEPPRGAACLFSFTQVSGHNPMALWYELNSRRQIVSVITRAAIVQHQIYGISYGRVSYEITRTVDE